jgi:hypothetical protein
MLHSILSGFAIGLGTVAAVVTAPFVGGHTASSPIQGIPKPQVQHIEAHAALKIASTTVACVSAAVNAREAAIDTAEVAFTSALNSAYNARASALVDVYTASSTTGIRAGVKSAWSTFATSTKSARMAWKTARTSAWQQYTVALKSCKSPSVPTDTSNQSLEVSGD